MSGRSTIPEEECPVCGKVFCVYDREEWAYKYPGKNRSKLCCSWHCLRSREEKLDGRKFRGRKPNEKAQRILEMLKNGMGIVETSKTLSVPESTVRYWNSRR